MEVNAGANVNGSIEPNSKPDIDSILTKRNRLHSNVSDTSDGEDNSRKDSDDGSSSSSSDSSDSESGTEENVGTQLPKHEIPEENANGDDKDKKDEMRDSSVEDSSSSPEENTSPSTPEKNNLQKGPESEITNNTSNNKGTDSSNNSTDDEENDEIVHNNEPEANNNQLHGTYSDNDSTSSSDEEERNAIPQYPPESKNKLALSLKKALEEREREKEKLADPEPIHDSDHSDIDDMSIRARTAEDFKADLYPPVIPPKMSAPPALPPKSKTNSLKSNPLDIFHVPDKTASLSRGRWSDDEDELPPARKQPSNHLPPDRIIDFTQGNKSKKKPKRSSSASNRRHHDPLSRIVDIPSCPPQDKNDAFKRQAMVSLHSSAHPRHSDGIDPYDTVHEEDNEDLNRLIQEANSLAIAPHSNHQDEPAVDVLYPSYQPKSLQSTKPNLGSNYPDVFNKLATKQQSPISSPVPDQIVEFSAIPQGPHTDYIKSLPKRRKSFKDEPFPDSKDPQDGDDEISLAESDFRFASLPAETPKSLGETPYLCEVHPSDFTDFDTETETDEAELDDPPQRFNSLHHDITPYDTVADVETDLEGPGNNLNPIVNDDYQICTGLDKNRNTFPRRMKEGKPKAKERTGLNSIMAVALTDPSTNSKIQPTSLPYLGGGPTTMKRAESNPDLVPESGPTSLFGQTPQHIVVTRGPTAPEGCKQELPVTYSGPRSLPAPRRRKKSKPEAPKIHLSLGQKSTSDTDNTVISNPNNLQINLLPSEDPNVINLNIRSASLPPPKEKETPAIIPSIHEPIPEPSPLAFQPVVPMTAITHTANPLPASEPSNPPPSQHRVVDIAPIMISTAPIQPEPTPVLFSEPQVVPSTTTEYAVRQLPHQTPPILTRQQEPIIIPTPVVTQETRVFDQPRTESVPPPREVVVDIHNPWEDKSRSLPSNIPPESIMRHGGDSGIDLTNYEGKRRTRRITSSSSEESDYDTKRRISKRKLTAGIDPMPEEDLSNEYVVWYKQQYLKPTCCYLFIKHFIFVLNLIFGIAGIVLIGLGIWGFADLISNGLEDPQNLLIDPIFPIFIIGVIITLVCFQGAVGFFRDNICMIRFFGWCMILLCICFVGGGVAFWIMREGQITPFVMTTFQNMIKNYNTTSGKVSAFTIDQMQSNFECCGMEAYYDWQENSMFLCRDSNCPLPRSCCHLGELECSRSEAEGARRYEACMDAMALWLKNHTAILVGVWVVIILFFLVNFICIYFMIREIMYLHLIQEKIFAITHPGSEEVSESSSDVTTDSEYEERQRRRRRRKRRERRDKKKRSSYVNRSYR